MDYASATVMQQKLILSFMKVWSDLLNITESNFFTHFSSFMNVRGPLGLSKNKMEVPCLTVG